MNAETQGWTVRDATADDYERFTELFAELGAQVAPPTRDGFLARDARSVFFVCDASGRAVGYGLGRVSGERWYVSNVVTAPEARGLGVGRAIMDEHARRARAAGLSRWALNVKRDNATAIRLYERCGMTVAARSLAVLLAWGDVARLAPSPAHEVVAVSPAEASTVEALLRLAPGQIASERARPERVQVSIRDGEGWAGFASFDPSFPGASPFRVADARWARALLEAMRPHARPADEAVRLTVEGDDALAAALAAAGAVTMLELYSMNGALRSVTAGAGG